MKHEATAKPKLRRMHPWRGFVEKPSKGQQRREFDHPALPSALSRPIR